MSKQFIRTKEDFVCEKCGHSVNGTGYTNHCPSCLWSKHVDNHPGDRAALCGGLMEPREVSHEGGEQILTHVCIRCGHSKRNKVIKGDNFETLLMVSRKHADEV